MTHALARLKSASLALTIMATLSGCGAPSTFEKDPDQFETVASGVVPAGELSLFQDCIVDGFDKLQTASLRVRTQLRSQGSRVEAVAGPHAFIVADIRDDGTTTLSRGYGRGWFSMNAHQDAYRSCLRVHGK